VRFPFLNLNFLKLKAFLNASYSAKELSWSAMTAVWYVNGEWRGRALLRSLVEGWLNRTVRTLAANRTDRESSMMAFAMCYSFEFIIFTASVCGSKIFLEKALLTLQDQTEASVMDCSQLLGRSAVFHAFFVSDDVSDHCPFAM